MKKLITIATLGLALSFPTLSSAFVPEDHIRLQYGTPTVESAAAGGQSEAGIMVFGVELPSAETKAAQKAATLTGKDSARSTEQINVLGVEIPLERGA